MRRRVLISTSLLSLLAVAPLDGVAAGQDNPFERGEKDRFSISLGTFVANFDTVLRLDSAELGVGTTIDLEDDLSYPRDRTDTRLDGYVRLGRKHRLEFGALILDRNKSTVTSRRIQFGEEVYDVGASVDSEFRNRVLKLAYKYSIVRNPRWEAGVSVGLSIFDVEARIAGQASVDPATDQETAFAEEKEDLVAPVPLFGAHVDVKLGRKFFFRGSGEIFDIEIDDIDASLTDFRGSLDWYPFKHWGFGLGYNRVRIKYTDVSETTFDSTYTYDGLLAYLTYVY